MIRRAMTVTLLLAFTTLLAAPALADCGNCPSDKAKKESAACAKECDKSGAKCDKACDKKGAACAKDCAKAGKAGKAEECPMTPEQMAAWQKSATPGAQHKALAKAEGAYSTACKFWMTPDSPAKESAGHSHFKMILGGRFLQENFHGTMAGMPFEGLGIIGYDNTKRRWTNVWMDTMGTMTMHQTGAASLDGRTINWVGSFTCPMTGKQQRVKSVSSCTGPDTHTFEMWNQAPDGKMFKSLEVAYTRKH